MKICFLITGLSIGGAERFLLKLLPRIKYEKFVISLTNSNEFGKQIEKKGIKVYYLGLNKLNLPLVIFRFGKIIKGEKPEIIDTYLIHSNLFGRFFGKIYGVKKIISSIRNDYSDLKLLNFIEKHTKTLIDLYIINSMALLNYIHRMNGVPLNRIKFIPNGIDIEAIYNEINKSYDVRKELGLNNNRFIIICISRLNRQKNLSILIKALKYVDKSIILVIIGKGPLKNELIHLTTELGLNDRIYFLGNRMDVFNLIRSSNVFVLPSLKEGMSNALLEAMALKKICIVSNIPQNKELIKDGFNGFLFNPYNEKELANIIEWVYKNNSLKSFGEVSLKLIKEKYNINKIIKEYEEIIENLIF